jgi:regulator of protease activity HflC (stomatin/prohibitin superfamily)
MLQADLRRLEAQQTAQAEVHRLEMEVVQAQRVAEAQRMQDMFSFMASLQALPGVVVPESLLAPIVARPPPAGTPVSIYGCLVL